MDTIGLRALNRNPSKAVARVRAGASLLVTDRGRPVLRMVPVVEPATESTTLLARLVAAGEARAPAQVGMPDLIPALAPDEERLADRLLADRNRAHHASTQTTR